MSFRSSFTTLRKLSATSARFDMPPPDSIPEQEVSRRRSSSSFANKADMAVIVVGNHAGLNDRRVFQIHKFLLVDTSEVFKAAAAAHTYMFDEEMVDFLTREDPDLFSFVVQWLYEERDREFKPLRWNEEHPSLRTFWDLYNLAQKLKMPGLENHIAKHFHAWRMEKPHEFFAKVKEILVDKEFRDEKFWDPKDSNLADFIIDFAVWYDGFRDSLRGLGGIVNCYPAKFLKEVLQRYAENARFPSDTAPKGWLKTDPSLLVAWYMV